MSSDDQHFLDLLSSIPNDVKRYSNEIASFIEKQFQYVDRQFEYVVSSMRDEHVTSSLRGVLQRASWLPDSFKPPRKHKIPVIPISYLERTQIWLSRNRAVTAAIVAFVGTGVFIIWRQRQHRQKKRRARRTASGAKTEVVVLAGSPLSPLTRSLSLDLERRGFIIYIPVGTLLEEQLVQSESRSDIRPLHLDITSTSSVEDIIEKFTNHLTSPQQARPTAISHTLHLASLILLPPTPSSYLTGSLTKISSSAWSDTLHINLLAPFTIVQAFLPLLCAQKSKVLFLSPNIIPSLTLPAHAPESVIAGGLENYVKTLRKEVSSQGVQVILFKLGNFDFTPHAQSALARYSPRTYADSPERDTVRQSWGAKGFVEQLGSGEAKKSSMRELQNQVFDAIAGKGTSGTVFVGRGSRAYELVGRWAPESLVSWMMSSKVKARVNEIGDASMDWEKVDSEGIYDS